MRTMTPADIQELSSDPDSAISFFHEVANTIAELTSYCDVLETFADSQSVKLDSMIVAVSGLRAKQIQHAMSPSAASKNEVAMAEYELDKLLPVTFETGDNDNAN